MALIAAGGAATGAPPGQGEPLGSHVVTHFRVSHAFGAPTAVFALETDAGELVMYAIVAHDRLYATNGNVQGPNRFQFVADFVEEVWHRLDVTLHGNEYHIAMDQTSEATLRTATHATVARPLPDPSVLSPDGVDVEIARQRVDASDGGREHTFTRALPSFGWSATGDGVGFRPTFGGHQSQGYGTVNGDVLGAHYFHASLAGFGGQYGAEASAHPGNTIRPPLDMAVLAGLTGSEESPVAHWSVVFTKHGATLNQWSFTFVAPDGSRTLVGGPWNTATFHSVRARVDEPGGSIVLSVDEGLPIRFDGLALGTSERLGVGDIYGALDLRGHGGASFDDLAVYKEAS